jgi:hypothetical protein
LLFVHNCEEFTTNRLLEGQYSDDNKYQAINTVLHLRSHGGNILKLLWNFHSSECSSPQDKIFALISLTDDLSQEKTMESLINYNDNWVDTYCSLAQEAIEAGYAPDVLQHLLSFGSLAHALGDISIPSYVPDWRTRRTCSLFQHITMRESCLSDFDMQVKDGETRSQDYVTIICWPQIAWDYIIYGVRSHLKPLLRLLAFGIVHQYFELDQATEQAIGLDHEALAMKTTARWREVYRALKRQCGISKRYPFPYGDLNYDAIPLSAWLKQLIKTHTIRLPRNKISWTVRDESAVPAYPDPFNDIVYKYEVTAAIGFGDVREGDAIAGHSLVQLAKIFNGSGKEWAHLDLMSSPMNERFLFGIIVRKVDSIESGDHLSITEKQQAETERSKRNDETWRVICPCILSTERVS